MVCLIAWISPMKKIANNSSGKRIRSSSKISQIGNKSIRRSICESKFIFNLKEEFIFSRHPTKFWGYFGKRIKTIREAKPNKAFFLLKQVLQKYNPSNYFIITENDHGFLEKAEFDLSKVWEIFGNANYFQCGHGNLIYNLCNFTSLQLQSGIITLVRLPFQCLKKRRNLS